MGLLDQSQVRSLLYVFTGDATLAMLDDSKDTIKVCDVGENNQILSQLTQALWNKWNTESPPSASRFEDQIVQVKHLTTVVLLMIEL